MNWSIRYLDDVENWLNQLERVQLKSVAKELKLLELCGNELKLPHSKALGKGLFELRERTFGLRIYYCFHGHNIIVLLSGGDKTSQKRDIKKAKKYLNLYKKDSSNED